MKITKIALILGGILLTNMAVAATKGPYVGAKIGSMSTTFSTVDPLTNVGIYGGYQLTPWFGIEAEYTTNLASGDFIGSDSQWDLTTTALYATFKTTKRFYFKGKVGLLNEQLSVTTNKDSFYYSDDSDDDVSDTGLSLGAGAGFNVTEAFSLEGELTLVEADVYYFSLGGKFTF